MEAEKQGPLRFASESFLQLPRYAPAAPAQDQGSSKPAADLYQPPAGRILGRPRIRLVLNTPSIQWITIPTALRRPRWRSNPPDRGASSKTSYPDPVEPCAKGPLHRRQTADLPLRNESRAG